MGSPRYLSLKGKIRRKAGMAREEFTEGFKFIEGKRVAERGGLRRRRLGNSLMGIILS